MWSGPVIKVDGCNCGFIDGYHGWHLYECDLMVKRRAKNQKDNLSKQEQFLNFIGVVVHE